MRTAYRSPLPSGIFICSLVKCCRNSASNQERSTWPLESWSRCRRTAPKPFWKPYGSRLRNGITCNAHRPQMLMSPRFTTSSNDQTDEDERLRGGWLMRSQRSTLFLHDRLDESVDSAVVGCS